MDIDDMPLVKQLGTLIRDKKYGKALGLCISSEIEIESNLNSNEDKLQHSSFYFIYICLYIIMNEYHGARHLFHRLPVELKDQTNFITLWEILKHLWNKRVHDALTILLNTSWSTNDTYLIDSMVNEIRSAEIRHISLIYRSMYVKDLEARLLLSTDDVIALCSKHGWHMDEDSALSLTPVVTQVVSSEVDAQIVDECMKDPRWLEDLTGIVSFLEKEALTATSSSTAAAASSATTSTGVSAASQAMAIDH